MAEKSAEVDIGSYAISRSGYVDGSGFERYPGWDEVRGVTDS